MQWFTEIEAIRGPLAYLKGPLPFSIGQILQAETDPDIQIEITEMKEKTVMGLFHQGGDRVKIGMRFYGGDNQNECFPDMSWSGCVLNAYGRPLNNGSKRLWRQGKISYALKPGIVSAPQRQRIGPMLETGVKVLQTFVPLCLGQRVGIFAGAGVGKTALMAQLVRCIEGKRLVIGLIGERGREVREFLEDYLGTEGLKRATVVVSTSDESPLLRRRAAYLTLSISEFFRDQGEDVVCFIDSLTRFAMAIREIALWRGEIHTQKGYPPSLYHEMAHLLERMGPGKDHQGFITGINTVLVENDDLEQDPVGDMAKSLLDGHIVLSRSMAEKQWFPAVDVVKSLSRMAPGCYMEEQANSVSKARRWISEYRNMEELIQMGAYTPGSSKNIDQSIAYYRIFQAYAQQDWKSSVSLTDSFRGLEETLYSI